MINSPDAMIVLPHFKVQNVNAISSPLTWGFPAITAILGFVHALERKLSIDYTDLKFGGVGVVCHDFVPQVFNPNGRDALFCLTRNPVDKDGSTPALVEEGRAHMEISLVVQVYGENCIGNDNHKKMIAAHIFDLAQTLRLAGGSILPESDRNEVKPQLIEWAHDDQHQKEAKKILRRLLPGFLLMSREDLLAKRTAELQVINQSATALDALLEYSSINYEPLTDDPEAVSVEWSIRKKPGWIVPIPVGYSAISECYEAGKVLNSRDNFNPLQFVESIYSLGQWLSPHRIKNIDDIFWHYNFDVENGLYRCINNPEDSIKNLNLGVMTNE